MNIIANAIAINKGVRDKTNYMREEEYTGSKIFIKTNGGT